MASKLAAEKEFAELIRGDLGRKLKAYAIRQSGRTFDAGDLEAEGLVAMWSEFQRLPDHIDSHEGYLLQVAKHRILDVIRLENWTGREPNEPMRLRLDRYKGTGRRRQSVRAQNEHAVSPESLHDVEAWDDPDMSLVEISDVRAEVRRAMREVLTPLARERLYRKFWLGERVDLLPWWYHPQYGARAKLQNALSHLTKGA